MPYADNDTYNVVLNSLNKVAGGTNADATYYFDWSVIPKGEYFLTVDYMGGANSISTPRFATLSIDLGQAKNYITSATSTSAQTTKIYSHLVPSSITNTNNASYLINPNDNSPSLLSAVPNNNMFSVQVLNPDGTAYTDSNGAVNGNYIIILHLLRFNRELNTRSHLTF